MCVCVFYAFTKAINLFDKLQLCSIRAFESLKVLSLVGFVLKHINANILAFVVRQASTTDLINILKWIFLYTHKRHLLFVFHSAYKLMMISLHVFLLLVRYGTEVAWVLAEQENTLLGVTWR